MTEGTPTPTDWVGEYAIAREAATTELERRVLGDDYISDLELEAVQDEFVACARRLGFPVSDFTPYGGFSVDPGSREDELSDPNGAFRACEDPWNRVSYIYFQSRRNPEHIDEATLMARCLVRSGVVDKNFTAEGYIEDMRGDGNLRKSSAYAACSAQPATAFS